MTWASSQLVRLLQSDAVSFLKLPSYNLHWTSISYLLVSKYAPMVSIAQSSCPSSHYIGVDAEAMQLWLFQIREQFDYRTDVDLSRNKVSCSLCMGALSLLDP